MQIFAHSKRWFRDFVTDKNFNRRWKEEVSRQTEMYHLQKQWPFFRGRVVSFPRDQRIGRGETKTRRNDRFRACHYIRSHGRWGWICRRHTWERTQHCSNHLYWLDLRNHFSFSKRMSKTSKWILPPFPLYSKLSNIRRPCLHTTWFPLHLFCSYSFPQILPETFYS